jgi:hypothetical protein
MDNFQLTSLLNNDYIVKKHLTLRPEMSGFQSESADFLEISILSCAFEKGA